MIAIDRMTLGSPPIGFTFARTGRGGEGVWTVTSDATATGGRAIEQTSTEKTDYRFPLAISESLSAANLNAEIRFKAVAGKIDQAAGIVCGCAMPTTTMSSGPTRWRTMSGSIGSSMAGANNWAAPI